jgi:hypothetical protein
MTATFVPPFNPGVVYVNAFTKRFKQLLSADGALPSCPLGTGSLKLRAMPHREQIINLLAILRRGDSNYTQRIALVRALCAQDETSLAEVGTSEVELLKLQERGAVCAARMRLAALRNGELNYRDHWRAFFGACRDGKISFAALSVNRAELRMLWRKGCIVACLAWLKYLDADHEASVTCAQYLKNDMRAGRLSAQDIGRTEAEIHQYCSLD